MIPIEKIKENGGELKREVKERTVGYIVAAFGFVAGLAWNDAIKAFIDHLFPANGGGLFAKFIYALLITLAVVIATYYLTKTAGSAEKK